MAILQALIERVYPGDLPADIDRYRAEGKSWRTIAGLVSDECELTVTYESLRTWYSPESEDVAS